MTNLSVEMLACCNPCHSGELAGRSRAAINTWGMEGDARLMMIRILSSGTGLACIARKRVRSIFRAARWVASRKRVGACSIDTDSWLDKRVDAGRVIALTGRKASAGFYAQLQKGFDLVPGVRGDQLLASHATTITATKRTPSHT